MNIELTGKRALVCGSTQGIGKAVAEELATMGATVILLARNEDKLREVAATLPGTAKHEYIVADFSRPDELRDRISDYFRTHDPVQVLVNNSGGPPAGPILTAKTEEFIAAFNMHLVCNHILVQATVDGMKKSGYGRIINIISTSVKQPLKGLGVSNTIRAAVANWSKTMANELAPAGITVNNVLPGATGTQRIDTLLNTKSEKTGKDIETLRSEMNAEIPMGRIALPGEVAAAVAFLSSPAASYITGINVPVDGGRTSCL